MRPWCQGTNFINLFHMPTTLSYSKKRPRSSTSTVASRDGGEEVIQTSFRLPRSRWTRLQQLIIEERQTVQSLVITALEAEFERRGKDF